jgi:Phosphotransferase enzyme family
VSHPEKGRLVWNDPSWRHNAEHWIRDGLAELGLELAAPIEQPHVRAWGTVLRVPTDDGTLWFKASIPPLAYEVKLVETLAAHAPGRVPSVLAGDASRSWMLMDDAGTRLTDLHPDKPPVEVWKEFVPVYAQLQHDVATAASDLVAAGVPDRTLPRLAGGLQRVLENDRLVRPETANALDDGELARVRSLIPQLAAAIEAVSALGLPDTVHHDDLHASNVCVRDGAYRFIDWGDACVSQPLLSLSVPLAHVGPECAAEARDAYLAPWTVLRPHAELAAASDAAVLLALVTGVLKWELVSSGLSDEERVGYEDVIPTRLRYLLELACG